MPGQEDRHRWTVRVAGTEQGATAFARKHRFTVGAPATFDEEDPRISAVEYVLGALGADLVGGLKQLARARRVEVDEVEAVVQGELEDPLAHLGVVGATGQPKLAEAHVKVYVASSEAEEDVARLWAEVVERSPLVCTLKPAVRLKLEVKIAP